jgi:hypothetical protein
MLDEVPGRIGDPVVTPEPEKAAEGEQKEAN